MGRLKLASPQVDAPFELAVPSDRLDAMVAEQESGAVYYGECIYPPSKRRRQAEPSFLLYTTQQFLEHTAMTTAQQRLYYQVLCCAETAAAGRPVAANGGAGARPVRGGSFSLPPSSLGGGLASDLRAPRSASLQLPVASRLPPLGRALSTGSLRPLERLGQLEDEIILTATRMGLDCGRIARDFLPGWKEEGVARRSQALMESKVSMAVPAPQHPHVLTEMPPPPPVSQQQPQQQQPLLSPRQLQQQHQLPLQLILQQAPQLTQPLAAMLQPHLAAQQAQQQQLPLAGSGGSGSYLTGPGALYRQAMPPEQAAARLETTPPLPASQASLPAAPVQRQRSGRRQSPISGGSRRGGGASRTSASSEEGRPGGASRKAAASDKSTAAGSGGRSWAGRGQQKKEQQPDEDEDEVEGAGGDSAGALAAVAARAVTALATAAAGSVERDMRCTDPENGELRVCMRRAMAGPPQATTVAAAHGLPSLEGVRFFEEACVVDRDKDQRVYIFSLRDPSHCARLDEGAGADSAGRPVLSYSRVHVLYQLPDGTAWLEHSRLLDGEGLAALAEKLNVALEQLLPAGAPAPSRHDLFALPGRCHSRLQNVAGECWVFQGAMPHALPAGASGAAFLCRCELDVSASLSSSSHSI